MQDIRQWQMLFAILVAATIHTVAITVYMALTNPLEIEKILPPIILLRSPPPPPAPIPPQAQPQAADKPQYAPAFDPDLPSITLYEPAEPEPAPLDLTQLEVPVVEPVPEVEPEPKPQPLDLTQFEVPVTEPVPVPQRKPPPPRVAKTPAPPPPASQRSAPSAAPASAAVHWPERVDLLTTAQQRQLLTEYYVDDKSKWDPAFTSRDDAIRYLDMGFIDPSAPQDYIVLEDNPAYLAPGVDPHEGPLTMQELEETLARLVAAGTKRFIGRDASSVFNLSYAERQAILKAHYADDPRWAIGVIDTRAPDNSGVYGLASSETDVSETSPLTVQELNETLARLVKWGTMPIIGRKVASVADLADGERQAILENYYGKDPRWQVGVIDTAAPPDYLEAMDPQNEAGAGSEFFETASPRTIRERDAALREMLEKKLKEQKARDAGQSAPAPAR